MTGLVVVLLVSGVFSGGDSDGASSAQEVADRRPQLPGGGRRLLPDKRVVAYYGAPQDDELGALGIGSPDDAADKLRREAEALSRSLGIEAFALERARQRDALGTDYYWGGVVRMDIGGLHPAKLLAGMLRQHAARVYLLNTGWIGGPFGVGERIGIGHTRRLLRAAIAGELEHAPVWTDELFGLHVPLGVEGVPEELLHPRDRWADTAEYDDMARRLAERFVANFDTKFAGSAPQLAQYGPQL